VFAIVGLVDLLYQYWVHTEHIGKLGWFDRWFCSPSNHRVHHASNPQYLDKNMGMVLIIWDKIFGTYQAELDDVKPVYGLTKNIGSDNPLTVIAYEWKNISRDMKKQLTWKQRMMYIFGPPGWSHDGSTKTSKQMMAELESLKGNN
jgi:sterol desaturase/sphingolipid hydroxylase (fatty acid hydroxylase superfamily)